MLPINTLGTRGPLAAESETYILLYVFIIQPMWRGVVMQKCKSKYQSFTMLPQITIQRYNNSFWICMTAEDGVKFDYFSGTGIYC